MYIWIAYVRCSDSMIYADDPLVSGNESFEEALWEVKWLEDHFDEYEECSDNNEEYSCWYYKEECYIIQRFEFEDNAN